MSPTDAILSKSQEKFSLVFHGCPDPILITRKSDGSVIDANAAFEQMYGLPTSKVVGRTTVELGIWPDVTARNRMLELLKTEGRLRDFECAMKTHSGERRTGVVSAGPVEIDGESCLVLVFHDVTLQKKSEQALRESEERFHSLAAAAFEGIGITDSGRIIEVNDQMALMLGCTREELIGRSVSEFVAAESRPLVEGNISAGVGGPYEHLARRKDGTTFPVEVSARSFVAGPRHLRVTSIRDITARKAAEESLRASEERLRATIENTPHVAVQWYDAEGRVVFWNQASEGMYGWPASEAVGKTLDQLIQTPEQTAEFLRELREVHRTGRPFGPVEYQFRRRNGREGTSLSTIFRIPTAHGECCFVCMDVDISEQKRATEALRASEERFGLAVRASNEGIWDWNVGTNEVYHSPRVRELLGYSPAEFPDFLESFDVILHPEDRERTWKAVGEHLERRVPFDAQFRLKTKSGEYRWFRSRGQAVWDGKGRAVRMAGSMTDIHDHKLAEESLRRAQAEALVAHEKFTQRLISAQEQERKRLANELHDSLGQNLSLIKNRAYLAAEQPGVPPNAANHIEAIGKVATEAIAEVRNLAQNLRPLHIEQFGLTDSLQSLVEQVQPTTPIVIERRLENVDDLYGGEEATILYRIVQEALNNLVKHAKATRATLSVERDLHCVRLRIEDDGRGFDLQAITVARRTRTGIGLTSIGERVRMLGGTLQIETAPGRGTKIKIELPLVTPPPVSMDNPQI
jgi:two-component system sensor histidine kinase UhpB